MKKMLADYSFDTLIDVGCVDGAASKFFTDHGKTVSVTDYGKSVHFENTMAENVIIGDFNKIDLGTQYDAIWCSHVLEHQLDVQRFLTRNGSLLRREGWALPFR